MLNVGDTLGPYVLEAALASGGMGAVYRARNRVTGQLRALKVVRADLGNQKDFIDRFVREATIASQLRHPNLVETLEPGIDGETVYLPMELLIGETLAARLKRVQRFTMAEAASIIVPVAEAVHQLHQRGVIHRDLKPANIFIARVGEVDVPKVIDLGTARDVDDDEHTRTGLVVGSPYYMAIEQAEGRRDIDGRADQYSLGVVAYEMLTGRPPFEGNGSGDLIAAHLREPPPLAGARVPLPDIVDQILQQCLRKNPQERFQSMAELVQALGQAEQIAYRSASQPTIGVDISGAFPASRHTPVPAGWTPTPTPAPAMRMATPPAGVPMNQPTTLSGASGHATASRRRGPVIVGVAVGALAIGGIALAVVATRKNADKPDPTPPIAASVTLPVTSAKSVEATVDAGTAAPALPAKVALQLDADVPGARVVFRRHVNPTPFAIEIAPIDVVELVEVSAPNHKTERYWLTFDRPTHLRAHLAKGTGIEEATEEQTLVALGEAAAPPAPAPTPTPAPAPVAVATAPTGSSGSSGSSGSATEPAATPPPAPPPPRPTPRKIGKAGADDTVAAKVAAAEPVHPTEPTPTPGATPVTPPPIAPAPVAAPAPPRGVSPSDLRNLLTSKTTIEVPSIVQTQMKRDDKKTASATIKVCVGTAGEVTTTAVLKSSGYPAYDEQAVAAIRGWRYKPFMADGHAVAICSAVISSFALQ